jgi:hypothetical protein
MIKSDTAEFPLSPIGASDMQRRDDAQFLRDMDTLIREAEEVRMKYMYQHRNRSFLSASIGIFSIMAGAGGFAWYFFMETNIVYAIACMVVAILPSLLLNNYADRALKAYLHHHKTEFMPKMANILGGLQFYETRGISGRIIEKTGIIPEYGRYDAEDCFMGVYKGVKVIMSEARLYKGRRAHDPIFDGLFVLLEIPSNAIEGHTILSADGHMVSNWANTRWRRFKPVRVDVSNPSWDRFRIFSSDPEAASLLVGEKLLKELSEAADIFDNAPLSAVLFGRKYIFITIPYKEDMFEAYNMYFPVSSKKHAMKCKREINQILEIIDLYELYKAPVNTTLKTPVE